MNANLIYQCMAEPGTRTDESESEGHQLAVVSVERSEAEKREAYEIEPREPADRKTFTDRVRKLF
jgi:hypothetical protein